MSMPFYRQYRKTLKDLPFDGRIMPYNWGGLRGPLSGLWMPYAMMFEEFSRELANAINAFTTNIQRLQAWALVVAPLSDRQKMQIAHDFVDTLATNVVNAPYMLRSRFIFATAHLCHQANRVKDSGWKDDLPLDKDIYINVADSYGQRWRKYGALKRRLEMIGGRAYRDGTHDFRNAYNHRFSPRFIVGMTNFVRREIEESTGAVTYSMGDLPPLELNTIARLLIEERNACYLAFDAFRALVREHESMIMSSLPETPGCPSNNSAATDRT